MTIIFKYNIYFDSQFGYVLGFIIFPGCIEMQFVLFVTAVCLMKGISNLWTVILGGNIDLSITISIINNFLACGKLNAVECIENYTLNVHKQ